MCRKTSKCPISKMLARRNDNVVLASPNPVSIPLSAVVGAGSVATALGQRVYGSFTEGKKSKKSSKKSPKKRKKDKVDNAREVVSNKNAAPVIANGKKTKAKKSSKRKSKSSKRVSKQVAKAVKRAMKTGPMELIRDAQSNVFAQIVSGVNKVRWKSLELPVLNDWLARQEWTVIGNNDANNASRIEDIDATALTYLGKKFIFRDTYNFHFKNNTNSPCDMVIYLVKCQDQTQQSPVTEITELRKAAFSDTSVLPLEDDFNQFWTVERIASSKRKWVLHKKWSISLGGGEEANLFVKTPKFKLDPSRALEAGSDPYQKGQYGIIARTMGKVTHDKADLSFVGVANTQIDYRVDVRTKTYMESSQYMQVVRQKANEGVTMSTPVIADPEQVGIGAYNAGA